jgi:serine/threonine protein kinase
MEYYPGGELYYHLKRVKKFSEEHAKFYFCEVLLSLKYLHEKDIAYRDLKPENIVIDIDGHARLTDFGLSKMDMRDESRSFCGSPEYMSPEMLRNQGHSKQVDLYCLGVLLFELLTGNPPFYDKDKNEMYLKILNNSLIIPEFISEEPRHLLTRLLDKNPRTRIGSEEGILEVMKHPWLKNIDFSKLLEKKIDPPFVPDLQSSHIGGVFSGMKVNPDFFSDSEIEADDQLAGFEFNSRPDSSHISRFYFEQTKKLGSKTPNTSLSMISGLGKKSSSIFSLSPHLSPSISINFSNESSKEYEKPIPKFLGKILEKSEELRKIPELNSPHKSTNFSFSSSN